MKANVNKHIEFRKKRDNRLRPFIAGTQVEVQYIVKDHEWGGMSSEEIAQGYDNVSIAQVHAALAYYHDNRDEVRKMIRDDEAIVKKLRGQINATAPQGDSTDASSSAIPS